jgi:hypothetical protein
MSEEDRYLDPSLSHFEDFSVKHLWVAYLGLQQKVLAMLEILTARRELERLLRSPWFSCGKSHYNERQG